MERPTYLQVCTGTTGHAEAVQVLYDTSKVTYKQLLDAFWCAPLLASAAAPHAARGDARLGGLSALRLPACLASRHNINPTTPNQQFVDKGPQYRSAVFYHSPEQKAAAVRAWVM